MGECACEVRYVSNAGLLFRVQDQLLGIDLFCRDSAGLYPDTTPKLRQELFKEIADGRLDTLIFTHGHEDHFCLEDVLEAGRQNSRLRIISTGQVIEELCKAGMPGENLIAVSQSAFWLESGAFRIGAFYSVHEGAQYAQVQNLTLLMEASKQRWVVAGDAAPSGELFAKIGAWSKTIDCFFLPFPYVGLPSTRRMLGKELEIRRIFVLHQPRREADTQDWTGHARAVCRQAKDGLPMPLFPEGLGEWYSLELRYT